VGVQIIGNGKNPYIVALGRQFVKQILHRGDHAVGVGGEKICSNEDFEFMILGRHGIPPKILDKHGKNGYINRNT
jgi:hypothetical protein